MGGAGFLVAINAIVACLLVGTFLLISRQHRTPQAGQWMALGYGLAVGYFFVEVTIANLGASRLLLFTAFASFLAAVMAMNVGLARKYEQAVPWRLLLGIFVVGAIVNAYGVGMPRESFLRQIMYQIPYAAMAAAGGWIIMRFSRRSKLDVALAMVLVAFGANFLAKPFLALGFGGVGAGSTGYIRSTYALISQALGTVFAIALALGMLLVMVRDIVSDMSQRSETDQLSGLLNRRGFEDRARTAFVRSLETGLPASLVICDLDRFKSVNDTYGHAVGDQAIAAFGRCLDAHVSAEHLAGRIGGEEFAIVLPRTSLSGARLFAEAVRSAFASTTVDGVPETVKLTASFGVAELQPGERFSDLLHRADAALYRAKDAGRDRVRLAELPANDRSERRAFRAV